ncbi:phosphoribosylaminoimidazole carboxylase, chloroplastic isoform X1 [Iris pallida]|uniref:phosphoribosylaminoimidazole carboxylase n=1 Tax=Iris pallida TaxID=29817 RepID=A0AAX6HNC0_IRIPA|nr:phosphoribosylaminoimidazole carboxylase, chloroplastic isoform X1 [Iris pallida]
MLAARFSSGPAARLSRPCNRDRLSFSSFKPSALPQPTPTFGGSGKKKPLLLRQPQKGVPSMSSSRCDSGSPIREDDFPIHGVSNATIGILGGGQLGKMMCQAASCMAVKVIILDPLDNCPASVVSDYHVIGKFDDGETVREFAKRCQVLTVEIEHVDADALDKLEQQGIDCQPKASTIRIIQDKYIQKVHFSQHGIPLPEFMQIDSIASAERAGNLFGYPLMIKSKRLAYDGRGNAVAHSKEELPSAVSALGGFDRGLYVEKWTPFVKELAVIVARGRDGSISCYPVVETIHKDNICHIVEAPANVPGRIKELSVDVAQQAVSSLEGAGVFAVELFLTKDGKVLLNEVAPRPHNSGHHTIESCYTSQYEQHLRAIIGLPLGDTTMKTPAAIMYNILGEDEGEPGFCLANQLISRALSVPGASVHWYGKPEMRKQRKMGHITIVGPSMNIVKARLDQILKNENLGGHTAVTPQVAVIMGSDSDLPVMKDAAEVLKNFNVPFELTIVSAHRTPERMYSFSLSAKERGIQVIIAGAGGAAHLPGMVASLTPLPVIGVPIRTSSLDGVDSLLSIVQMPKGIPVATVAIGNAANAGLLAVRILAAGDADLWDKLIKYQEDLKDTVLAKADKLEAEGWQRYLNP